MLVAPVHKGHRVEVRQHVAEDARGDVVVHGLRVGGAEDEVHGDLVGMCVDPHAAVASRGELHQEPTQAIHCGHGRGGRRRGGEKRERETQARLGSL